MLLPSLADPTEDEALRAGGRSLSYRELKASASALAARVGSAERVAVWASPTLETCVAVVGVLLSGAAVVPINPKTGPRELEHVLRDSGPGLLVASNEEDLPDAPGSLPRIAVDLEAREASLPHEPGGEAPAFVFYTSGTTGPPKGVVLPRRAVTSNLDALARVWEWTPDDVLTHGLPLFHVHGLILGVLGPLRTGGSLRYAGRFSPQAVGRELAEGATMLFGVPTMYHALAEAAEREPETAKAMAGARLLVSGSAPLPVREFHRIERATGQQIVERYGLTETIMNCAVHADAERRPGYVGPPLPGVELRLVDDEGNALHTRDDETIGEVSLRGPNLFLGYLNRPDATAEVMRDGWFHTGDLATVATDGYVRIVGRRATDLIKTGGFKVGAGEVEAALLEHPGVAEAAVTGEPDERLGERIVAWVVLTPGEETGSKDLEEHVAGLLAPHKRPREVRFLDALPRNEMGKIRKNLLKG
ncbi:MAG TPA: acyl-CoA synthetase [Actinomycetota bacterium]